MSQHLRTILTVIVLLISVMLGRLTMVDGTAWWLVAMFIAIGTFIIGYNGRLEE